MIYTKEDYDRDEILKAREEYLRKYPGAPYPLTVDESMTARYFIGNATDSGEVYFSDVETMSLVKLAIEDGMPLVVNSDMFGDTTLVSGKLLS